MAEFRFRLDAVLRVRQNTRDQCRLRLAEVLCADETLRERLSRLGAEYERLQADRRQALGHGELNIERLVDAERYAAVLKTEENALRQERETLAGEIQRRRETLLEADRNAKALEKLRERQRQRYRLEEERREAKRIDEVAAQMCSSKAA